VGRPLLPLLAALCLLACTNSGQPTAAASPNPSPSLPAASPAITIRLPSEVILADADVALPRTAGRDAVSLAQAASEQENQPLALTQYRAWGWVEEATRSWAGGSQRMDESLVLLTRSEGGVLAFQGWAGDLGPRSLCPDSLALDECAVGSNWLVGRVGRYTFRLVGSGANLVKLAGLQAAKIRMP
jgi:hypothetical protein